MRVLKRRSVHKKSSVRNFRNHARKTKAPNMAIAPQRGGWRL